MSNAAFAQSKEVRRRCESCQERKARFRYRGHVKADRDHTLCVECFRSERDRRRARMLADVRPARAFRAPFCVERALTPRAIEHRERMLAQGDCCASACGACGNVSRTSGRLRPGYAARKVGQYAAQKVIHSEGG